jgi:hypothetical protein
MWRKTAEALGRSSNPPPMPDRFMEKINAYYDYKDKYGIPPPLEPDLRIHGYGHDVSPTDRFDFDTTLNAPLSEIFGGDNKKTDAISN